MHSGGARESRDDVSRFPIGLNKDIMGWGSTNQCSRRKCAWSSFCFNCFLFLTPASAYLILVFKARCFFNGRASNSSSSIIMSWTRCLLGGCVAPASSQQLGWVKGESSTGRVVCDLKWRESAALEPCFLSQMMHWKRL